MSRDYLHNAKMVTVADLRQLKQRGEKITSLTCYDASFAALLDQCGIEVLLVGDSLGMVVQGQISTLPVTLADMVYHTRCVAQARQRGLLVADLPFASYADAAQAVASAALLMRAGAQMVKLEGAKCAIIQALVEQGIAVCGHLGLLPQSINRLGHYSVQARQPQQAQQLLEQALAIEAAGADLLVLECVPADVARNVSRQLAIPVIGIGAGVDCDGQVLVLYDMLSISVGHRPRFSKDFMAGQACIADAIAAYRDQVKSGMFPGSEQSY
jgi:3-methyl-2-oxobutanoate hydroxymethyltransferase